MRHSPPSKTILVVIVLLALAVIGIVFYLHRGTSGLAVHPVPETVVLPTPGQWPSTVLRDQTVTDNSNYYTVSAAYPVTNDTVINNYFQSFVNDSIAQFKDDISWAAPTPGSAAPSTPPALSLSIKYTEHKTVRADNFVFSTTTYTDGAHGLESTKTFSFSPTGQQVAVASLFSNGLDGLKTIAPYVKAQLVHSPGADATMIDAGTAPTVDNYQSFTIEDDGIIFIFDPYQVAPYAVGQQSVRVPLSVFSDIASKDIFTTR